MSQRLAAILAADVVGYSRMMGDDAAGTLAALRELRQELFEPVVTRHGGEVIKRMGDGWLVEFGAIAGAVDCAVEVQGQLQDHERIKLRMGIHFGDIVHEDEDIYGDGVNIAARLQEHGLPGGVLISDDVRRQLDGTRKQNFAVIGELALKNIVEPVAAAIWPPSAADEHAAAEGVAAIGSKPTVTVGEFSGSGEDGTLAQGIKDDLTTALSRQTGKDYVLDEATADYVVQGSVRSAGGRCRISAKLIDRAGGKQVWAEQYDFDTADPFEIQDACVYRFAGALRGQIIAQQGEKAAHRNIEDMTVEDILYYGTHKFTGQTRESWLSVGPLMERVLERDPDNFMAMGMAAFSVLAEWMYGHRAADPEGVKRAKDHVDKALRVNNNSDFLFHVQSVINTVWLQNYDEAVLSARRALDINPNYPYGFASLANAQALKGDYTVAIEAADQASDFDSQDIYNHYSFRAKALAYFALGDYPAAAASFALADGQLPGLPQNLTGMAASYWQADDENNARRICARLLDVAPDIRAGEVFFPPYRDRDVYDRFRESVIAAGLPA